MDINEKIEAQLNEFPLILYIKRTPDIPQSGFSAKLCGILKASDKRFAFVNILEDNELRDGLKIYSNWPTFPQLYVNGELIGGSDIGEQMYESGQLESLLETVQEN